MSALGQARSLTWPTARCCPQWNGACELGLSHHSETLSAAQPWIGGTDLGPECYTAGAHGAIGGISLSTFLSAYLDLWKRTVVAKHKEALMLQLNLGVESLDQKQWHFLAVSTHVSHFLIFAPESPRRKMR